MCSKKLIDSKTKAKFLEVGEVILYWIGGILLIIIGSTLLYYVMQLIISLVT